MTIPKVSKMITDRQKRYEFVQSFATTHRDVLAEALSQLLDENLPGPGAASYLDGLMRRLGRTLEDLVRAEQKHLDELGNDAALRKRRDTAVSELRQDLFHMRDLLRGVYSRATAEELGLERRIAPHPLALLRQGRRIESRLRDPGLRHLAPRFPGVTVTGESLAAAIKPRLRELREAIDDVTRDEGKAEGTKVEKDKAMNVFDGTYQHVVRTLVEAFHLAGKPELAARIPTSLRRRSRRTGEAPASSNHR